MNNRPIFVMLIGLPGAGKSYCAKMVKEEYEKVGKKIVICSSDEMRKKLFGDESIQNSPSLVFDELIKEAKNYLLKGIGVIFDATNLTRKNRKNVLCQLPPCYKAALVVWAKYEVCVERDKNRSRTVGEKVIKRMIRSFQPPYVDEGWNNISIMINSEKYGLDDYHDWMDCPHDNPHHNNSVGEHTHFVMNEMLKRNSSETFILAAKLHDIGKKFTKSYSDYKGRKTKIAHFYDHQNVGSYFALGFVLIDNDIEAINVAWLINVHMDPFFSTKYYKNLPPDLKKAVDLLHECDVEGA